MINLTDDVKQKYNVNQVADYDGSIKLVLTLKKRTCKCCGKYLKQKVASSCYGKQKKNIQ